VGCTIGEGQVSHIGFAFHSECGVVRVSGSRHFLPAAVVIVVFRADLGCRWYGSVVVFG
jgi:hypothetical protein